MKQLTLILLTFFVIGCASRKVDKTSVHGQTTVTELVVDSSHTKQHTTLIIQDTTSIQENTFEPIDSTKEMIINGKVFKNVKIKTTKTKKGISIIKEKDSVSNQTKTTKTDINQTIDSTEKHIDKGSSSWIWIIVIVGAVLIYLDFKNNK